MAGDAAARAALDGLVRGRLLVVRDAEQGADLRARARGAAPRLGDAAALARRAGRQPRGAPAARGRGRPSGSASAARARRCGARGSSPSCGVVDPDDLLPRETRVRRRLAPRACAGAGSRRALGARAGRRCSALVGCGGLKLQRRDAPQVAGARRARPRPSSPTPSATSSARPRCAREAFARFDAFERERGRGRLGRGARARAPRPTSAYGHAGQVLESALLLDARQRRGAGPARRRALRARAARRARAPPASSATSCSQRLALYDPDGAAPAAASTRPPRSRSRATRPAPAVSLGRFVEDDAQGRAASSTPRDARRRRRSRARCSPPGSYLLTLAMPGRAPDALPDPARARASASRSTIPLPEAARVPEGFVYVPPGRFLFGSAADEETRRSFFNTPPLHETATGAVPHRPARDDVRRVDRVPPRAAARGARPPGAPRPGADRRRSSSRSSRATAWQLSLQPTKHVYTAPRRGEDPLRGARAARRPGLAALPGLRRLARGRRGLRRAGSSSTGRVPGARLCNEREWERAARGADDREFPHGDHLEPDDADIDQTYGKEPLAFGPDEVGSHPASRSPFGLDDMCGNVFEWTTSSLAPNEHVLRGGGYYYDIDDRPDPQPAGLRADDPRSEPRDPRLRDVRALSGRARARPATCRHDVHVARPIGGPPRTGDTPRAWSAPGSAARPRRRDDMHAIDRLSTGAAVAGRAVRRMLRSTLSRAESRPPRPRPPRPCRTGALQRVHLQRELSSSTASASTRCGSTACASAATRSRASSLVGAALSGTRPGGGRVSGSALVGAELAGTLSNGAAVTLRIDARHRGRERSGRAALRGLRARRRRRRRSSRSAAPPPTARRCRRSRSPAAGTSPRARRRAAPTSTIPATFTFACEGYALAKCVELGYAPWRSVTECRAPGDCAARSLAPFHQACTRMLRADYCGDGTPTTRDGTPVDLWDGFGIQTDDQPAWAFEAEWSPARRRLRRRDALGHHRRTGPTCRPTSSDHCPARWQAPGCGGDGSTFFTAGRLRRPARRPRPPAHADRRPPLTGVSRRFD